MCNGRGGGGLSGECGGDCGRDLCLKGRGGFCHPAINKNCGQELEWAKNQRTIYPVGEAADLWLE